MSMNNRKGRREGSMSSLLKTGTVGTRKQSAIKDGCLEAVEMKSLWKFWVGFCPETKALGIFPLHFLMLEPWFGPSVKCFAALGVSTVDN